MVFSLDAKNKQVIFVKLVMIIHCSVKAQSRLLLNHHFCLTTKQPNFFKFLNRFILYSHAHMLCVIKSQSIMFHHLTMLRKEIIISFRDSNYMSIGQSRKAALIIERLYWKIKSVQALTLPMRRRVGGIQLMKMTRKREH